MTNKTQILSGSRSGQSVVYTDGNTAKTQMIAGVGAVKSSTIPATNLDAPLLNNAGIAVIYDPTIVRVPIIFEPPLLSDGDTIYNPTLTYVYALTAPLLSDSDTIYDPTITQGPAILTPPLLASTTVIYDPAIAGGAVTLAPPLLTDTDTLYSVTFTRGAVDLSPPLLDENDQFGEPSFNPTYNLAPPLLASTTNYFSHDFVPGPVTVAPPLVTEADTLPGPMLSVLNGLQPPLVTDADTIYNPTVTKTYTLAPPLVTDSDTLHSPTMSGGGILRPPLLTDSDTLFAPAMQRVKGQGNGGGGGGGGTVTTNLKYASTLVMDESGLITAVQTSSSSAKTINTRMAVYADNAGTPGQRLAVSDDKSIVVVGLNTYTLQTPIAVLAGTTLWIALHSDGNFNWFLQNSTGGARYNTDLFSDGASDPFGAASVDNKKSPLFVVFLESVNATIAPPLLTEVDALHAPSIVPGLRDMAPPLTGESFLYPPTITSRATLEMPFLQNNEDELFPPSVQRGTWNLAPPLLSNGAAPIVPALVSGAAPGTEISPALLTNENTLYAPELYNDLQIIAPPLLSNDAAPISPTLSSRKTLRPLDLENFSVIYNPTITRGVWSLLPPLLSNLPLQLIYEPSLTQQTGFLGAPLLDAGGALYPPSLRRPRRAHRVVIQGSSGRGPVVAGQIGSDVALEGDASGLDVQLEGSDA